MLLYFFDRNLLEIAKSQRTDEQSTQSSQIPEDLEEDNILYQESPVSRKRYEAFLLEKETGGVRKRKSNKQPCHKSQSNKRLRKTQKEPLISLPNCDEDKSEEKPR